MREIITIDNDPTGILRKSCKSTKTITPRIKSVAEDMVEYLLAPRDDGMNWLSIAAPQMGESCRVIAFFPNPAFREWNAIDVLVNPEIVSMRKYTLGVEGCLSMPGKFYRLRRASTVKIKGLTLEGRPKTYKAGNLFARMLQHEIDHLDGILMDVNGELVERGG